MWNFESVMFQRWCFLWNCASTFSNVFLFVIIIIGTTAVYMFVQNGYLSVLALQSTASTRVGTKSRQVTVNTPLSLWFELTNRLWIKRPTCYPLVQRGPHVSKMHNSRTVGYCLLYWTFCTIIFIVLKLETYCMHSLFTWTEFIISTFHLGIWFKQGELWNSLLFALNDSTMLFSPSQDEVCLCMMKIREFASVFVHQMYVSVLSCTNL